MVQVAAQSMSYTGVSQGAESAVQLQGVVVELLQVFVLRQLQDVQTPGKKGRKTKNNTMEKASHVETMRVIKEVEVFSNSFVFVQSKFKLWVTGLQQSSFCVK